MKEKIQEKQEQYRKQFEENAGKIKKLREEIEQLTEINLQLKGAFISLGSLLESEEKTEETPVEVVEASDEK
jgi:hypothetical protein